MIVFLIGYHYIFQPSLCGTAKSDGEMQPEEENKENEGKERTEKGEEAPEESPAGTVSVLLKSEEQAAPSEETETNATSEVVAEDILNMKDSSNVKSNANKNKKRMAFLDNTKIFLTALVVSHHTTCAFGGCRTTSWYLVVAMDGNPYCQSFLRAFATLNQAYFMPLFFFLSALFVPSSYDKIGPDKFLKNKRHRLLIPGCLTWVTICPACMVLQQVVRDNYDEIFFILAPGHVWFLVWLLLLCWMYSTFYEAMVRNNDTKDTNDRGDENIYKNATPEHADATNNLDETTPTTTKSTTAMPVAVAQIPFPSTISRLVGGTLICGLLQWLVVASFVGTPMVATIPLGFGSVVCDIFMFVMGILAKRNNWLDKTPRKTWISRIVLLLEGASLIILVELFQWWDDDTSPTQFQGIGVPYLSPFGVPFFVVAGMFCVDMGMAVVQFFQEFANTETNLTRYLAKAAYTVYLIHVLVVLLVEIGYIYLYNALASSDNQIFFPEYDADDPSTRTGQGGGEYYGIIGWVVVNILSHLIVWPLAHWISNLPYLKTML